MPTLSPLATALALTWLVEWAIVARWSRRRWLGTGLDLLAINALTNPLANLAVWWGGLDPWGVEVAVVLAEIPLYRATIARDWRGATALATAANLATAAIGFLWSSWAAS